MTRELSPFFISPLVPLVIIDHQSSREMSSVCGDRVCKPTFCSRLKQNYLANTQNEQVLNCFFLLITKENLVGWGRPCCAKRYVVYHLCATSHMKKQHLLGVPDPLPWPKVVLSDFLRWVACCFFCFAVTFHHAHQSSVILHDRLLEPTLSSCTTQFGNCR